MSAPQKGGMLKQLLKRDNALLEQMFVEAPLNCDSMSVFWFSFLRCQLLKSHTERRAGTGNGVCPVD